MKVDIKNAYPEAEWPKGKRVFMHMFQGHVQYDAYGKPMIYEVMRNYWGAPPAGALFGQWLAKQLINKIGFEEVRACLGMYRLPIEGDAVVMSTIVALPWGQSARTHAALRPPSRWGQAPCMVALLRARSLLRESTLAT